MAGLILSVASIPLSIVGTVLSPVITVVAVGGAVVGAAVVGTAVVVGGTAVVVGGVAAAGAAGVGAAGYGAYRLHKRGKKRSAQKRTDRETHWRSIVRDFSNKYCVDPIAPSDGLRDPVKIPSNTVSFGLGWGGWSLLASDDEQVDYDLFAAVFDREGNLIETVIGSAAGESSFLGGALVHTGNVASAVNLHEKGVFRENENVYLHTDRLPENVGAIVIGSILQGKRQAAKDDDDPELPAYINCVPIAGVAQVESLDQLETSSLSPEQLEEAYNAAVLFSLPLDEHEVGDRNAYLACKVVRIDEGGWAIAPVRAALEAFGVADIVPEMIEIIRPQIPTLYESEFSIDCHGGDDAKVYVHSYDRFGFLVEHREVSNAQPIALDVNHKDVVADVFVSVDRGQHANADLPVIGTLEGVQYSFGRDRFQVIGRITQKPVPASRAFSTLTQTWKLVPYARGLDIASAAQLESALRRTYNPEMARSVTIGMPQAFNLTAADFGGTSDPYIVVHQLADAREKATKKNSIYKTATVKKTIDPVWNDEKVTVPLEDWRSKPILRFALWDKDFGSGDDALGHCDVDLRTQPVPFAGGVAVSGGRGELLLWITAEKVNAAVLDF